MPRIGPEFAPQLASLVAAAPPGDDWVHEMKFDGYRILAICHGRSVRLLSRNGNDWTEAFRPIATDVGARELDAVLDGEVAVVLPDGTTSFEALQQVRSTPHPGLTYFVFDLLADGGRDTRRLRLTERKERLESLLAESTAEDRVRYSQHVRGGGPAFFAQACAHGLEGIVSKRAAAAYRPGRNPDWVKVKCVRRQEFVIGGFTEPSRGGPGMGAILVGHYVDGELHFAGRVGTGYTQTSGAELRARLEKLEVRTPAFVNPPRGAEARGVHWVAPQLVAEVGYTELTAEGILRHPSFKGLRPDRDPESVVLEEPVKTTPKKSVRKSAAKKTPKKPPARAVESPARAAKGKMPVGGIMLSSPGRIVYPELGITKLEVASYYEAMGEWLMPHFLDRPLTLVRCPDTYRQCFFQKHIDENKVYAHVVPIPVQEEKGVGYYGAVDSIDGVLSLVQLGALEFHTFASRRDKLDLPDKFTLDIDPDPSVPWKRVVQAAHTIRELLQEIGLVSFCKTTGGKGLHVVAPIQRKRDWDEVKEFTGAVASLLVQAAPREFTVSLSKAKRSGKILIDYLRNARGATAVEAFSTRARAGATVSTPVHWDEVTVKLKPEHFTVRAVPKRFASLRADPWGEYAATRQSITTKMMQRVGL